MLRITAVPHGNRHSHRHGDEEDVIDTPQPEPALEPVVLLPEPQPEPVIAEVLPEPVIVEAPPMVAEEPVVEYDEPIVEPAPVAPSLSEVEYHWDFTATPRFTPNVDADLDVDESLYADWLDTTAQRR